MCKSFMLLQFAGWVCVTFFLHCHYFTDIRKTLFNQLQSVDENILNQSDHERVELLLYGDNNKFPHKIRDN